jgi:hypothetical protein
MSFVIYFISTVFLAKIIDLKFFKKKNIYLPLFILFSLHAYLLFLNLTIINLYQPSIAAIIIIINIILISIFLKKNKIDYRSEIKNLLLGQNFIIFIFLLSIFFYLSLQLELSKFDELSSYGLYSKYIYYFRQLPNIEIESSKVNISSLNLLSFFSVLILDLFNNYSESYLIFSFNFLSLILAFSIIQILNIKDLFKTILLLIFFYSLSYILLSGFDRIYLETILGLLSLNIFFLVYQHLKYNEKVKFFSILILLCILILIKKNALLLVLGLSGFLCSVLLFRKRIIQCLLIILIPFLLLNTSNNLSKFKYTLKLFSNEKSKNNIFSYEKTEYNKSIHGGSIAKYFTELESFQIEFDYNKDVDISKKIIKNHIHNSISNGIYHYYLLDNLKEISNFIFKKEINYIPRIPFNVYVWSLIIIFLYYSNFKKPFLIAYYFLYLITYYIFLIYWGFKHSLIDYKNLLLQVSWERHLGLIIFTMFSFLFLLKFNSYNNKKIMLVVIILSLTMPLRSVRAFVGLKYINNDNYYHKINKQKKKWENFSSILDKKLENKSYIITTKIFNDPLDYHLLNYYSINHNIHDYNRAKLDMLFLKVFENKKNVYLITTKENLCITSTTIIDNLMLHKISKPEQLKIFFNCYDKNFD